MERLRETLPEILKNIEQITESFYQQKNNEGYQKLIEVIDSLSQVSAYLAGLEQTTEIVEKNKALLDSLNEATEALINKDSILLADIFKYDVAEILKELLVIL